MGLPKRKVSHARQGDRRAHLALTAPSLVECSHCHARTRVSYADLGVRLATISLWMPFQRHQHWMRCPACGRRRWCRIGWTE